MPFVSTHYFFYFTLSHFGFNDIWMAALGYANSYLFDYFLG